MKLNRDFSVIAAAGVLLASVCLAQSAQAQSVFCPPVVQSQGVQPGIVQQGGNCTNGNTGAFSGAALASQALGDLASTTPQMETNTAGQAIAGRRKAQPAAAPALAVPQVAAPAASSQPAAANTPGKRRIAKTKPAAATRKQRVANATADAPQSRTALARKPAARRVANATIDEPQSRTARTTMARKPAARRVAEAPVEVFSQPLITKGPSEPTYIDESFRIGAWAQAYGDYERRSGRQAAIVNCCANINAPPQSDPIPVTLDVKSVTTTGGVVGGIDWTRRNLLGFDDGLIFGALGGYMSSNVTVNSTSLSSQPTRMNDGSSRITAKLDGPSAGLYATYFNGAFSNDFLVKNDFLSLKETLFDSLAFGVCSCTNAPPGPNNLFTGSGSTRLNQLTISDNVNYRIALSEGTFVEPTVGVQYTKSLYSSSAAALGLRNGYAFRLQGGAHFGFETLLGATKLTTTLTGLVFENAVVRGNFIQGGVFGTNGNILNDQGKIQGEGILAFNFDFGRGVSAFAQGDVRGGDKIFGAGGKGGIRVQW